MILAKYINLLEFGIIVTVLFCFSGSSHHKCAFRAQETGTSWRSTWVEEMLCVPTAFYELKHFLSWIVQYLKAIIWKCLFDHWTEHQVNLIGSEISKLTKDQIINLFLTGMVSQYASTVSKNWIHNPHLHKVELFLMNKWYPCKNIRYIKLFNL